jgi:hypothetical protein
MMENARDAKLKPGATGLLEIYTFTGSNWQMVARPADGIGEIRLKDNLRRLGTSVNALAMPNVDADDAPDLFKIKIGKKHYELDFRPGQRLVAFKAGRQTTVWTDAKDALKIKG